jgi:3-isopropylmalate/(R)-2-methylmalate dehydratase small subunit
MKGLRTISGRAWIFGDHVDTDIIIPVRYCGSSKREELGPHAMAGLDPGFASRISPGDILVAGQNFGCGSSRENAPLALQGAGIGAVVALSFGRIFFRNAINVGLPIFESSEVAGSCSEGDLLRILPAEGRLINETSGKSFRFSAYPDRLSEIIECGGLVNYVKQRIAGR